MTDVGFEIVEQCRLLAPDSPDEPRTGGKPMAPSDPRSIGREKRTPLQTGPTRVSGATDC